MKRALCIVIACSLGLAALLGLAGCSAGAGKQPWDNRQSVIETARDRAAANSDGGAPADSALAQDKVQGGDVAASFNEYDEGDIDIDLTVMSGNAVYSTVYQMITNPDEYRGSVVKMQGIYYSQYNDRTGNRNYYVVVQDATACCAQGIEFVWDDGSHEYPDDYPVEGAEVVVVGVFGNYIDRSSMFAYLRDASLALVQ